jgi:hypothetical protein
MPFESEHPLDRKNVAVGWGIHENPGLHGIKTFKLLQACCKPVGSIRAVQGLPERDWFSRIGGDDRIQQSKKGKHRGRLCHNRTKDPVLPGRDGRLEGGEDGSGWTRPGRRAMRRGGWGRRRGRGRRRRRRRERDGDGGGQGGRGKRGQ